MGPPATPAGGGGIITKLFMAWAMTLIIAICSHGYVLSAVIQKQQHLCGPAKGNKKRQQALSFPHRDHR